MHADVGDLRAVARHVVCHERALRGDRRDLLDALPDVVVGLAPAAARSRGNRDGDGYRTAHALRIPGGPSGLSDLLERRGFVVLAQQVEYRLLRRPVDRAEVAVLAEL